MSSKTQGSAPSPGVPPPRHITLKRGVPRLGEGFSGGSLHKRSPRQPSRQHHHRANTRLAFLPYSVRYKVIMIYPKSLKKRPTCCKDDKNVFELLFAITPRNARAWVGGGTEASGTYHDFLQRVLGMSPIPYPLPVVSAAHSQLFTPGLPFHSPSSSLGRQENINIRRDEKLTL